MIVEYLRYTIADSSREAFVAAWEKAAEPLSRSEYCKSYELCRCVEDGSKFVIRIEWTSADDHLQRFRGSAEFREFFSHVKPFVGDIDEMRHYESLDSRAAS